MKGGRPPDPSALAPAGWEQLRAALLDAYRSRVTWEFPAPEDLRLRAYLFTAAAIYCAMVALLTRWVYGWVCGWVGWGGYERWFGWFWDGGWAYFLSSYSPFWWAGRVRGRARIAYMAGVIHSIAAASYMLMVRARLRVCLMGRASSVCADRQGSNEHAGPPSRLTYVHTYTRIHKRNRATTWSP